MHVGCILNRDWTLPLADQEIVSFGVAHESVRAVPVCAFSAGVTQIIFSQPFLGFEKLVQPRVNFYIRLRFFCFPLSGHGL